MAKAKAYPLMRGKDETNSDNSGAPLIGRIRATLTA